MPDHVRRHRRAGLFPDRGDWPHSFQRALKISDRDTFKTEAERKQFIGILRELADDDMRTADILEACSMATGSEELMEDCRIHRRMAARFELRAAELEGHRRPAVAVVEASLIRFGGYRHDAPAAEIAAKHICTLKPDDEMAYFAPNGRPQQMTVRAFAAAMDISEILGC